MGTLLQKTQDILVEKNKLSSDNVKKGVTIFGVKGDYGEDFTNLIASNIKKGVNIKGVTGEYYYEYEPSYCKFRNYPFEEFNIYDIGYKIPAITGEMCSFMFDSVSIKGKLDLTDLDVSGATTLMRMFYRATRVTEIDITGWNTSNVTSMYGTFENCSQLTTVTGIDNCNVSNVTTFRECFQSSGVQNLDFSKWHTNTAGVNIYGMFRWCSSLASVKFPSNWKITDTCGEVFSGCYTLTSLDLSGWDTSQITDMAWMFKSCNKLTELDLTSFNTSKVTRMPQMFSGCSSLTLIDLSSFDFSKVTDHSNIFDGVPTGCTIYVKNQTTKDLLTSWDSTHTYTIK